MIGFSCGAMLEVRGVHRKTKDSTLCGVDFDLCPGRIMGVVGDDRSGREMLLNHILGYVFPSKGVIRFMGEPLKYGDERIAPILPHAVYPKNLTLLKLERHLRGLYDIFRSDRYFELLSRFVLLPGKKVSQLDRGAQLKLQLAVALSTEAMLLVIFDGLDHADIMLKEELRELLLEFVSEGGSVLLSSRALENVENLIDDITFLHSGKQLFSESCDELPREFAVLRCSAEELEKIDELQLVGLTVQGGEYEALVHRVEFEGRGYHLETPTTADILRFSLAHERTSGEVAK
ncbi:MAG: hypothetical protein IJA85_07190 [Clostridia bacterium]|nr:hypothetical protein [Clostridia bacterium]